MKMLKHITPAITANESMKFPKLCILSWDKNKIDPPMELQNPPQQNSQGGVGLGWTEIL